MTRPVVARAATTGDADLALVRSGHRLSDVGEIIEVLMRRLSLLGLSLPSSTVTDFDDV
jgi:hypothetical protein